MEKTEKERVGLKRFVMDGDDEFWHSRCQNHSVIADPLDAISPQLPWFKIFPYLISCVPFYPQAKHNGKTSRTLTTSLTNKHNQRGNIRKIINTFPSNAITFYIKSKIIQNPYKTKNSSTFILSFPFNSS